KKGLSNKSRKSEITPARIHSGRGEIVKIRLVRQPLRRIGAADAHRRTAAGSRSSVKHSCTRYFSASASYVYLAVFTLPSVVVSVISNSYLPDEGGLSKTSFTLSRHMIIAKSSGISSEIRFSTKVIVSFVSGY